MKSVLDTRFRVLAEHCLSGPVLDVGYAAHPNPHIKNVVGVDIVSPETIPQNYRTTARCNLNKDPLPFPDGSFETVVAGDVIEHLENPSAFLRDVNRVLHSGGRLVLSTPQANDWWVTLHNWFFRRFIRDPDPGEHLQNWTILDMTRLLRKNGFRIITLEGLFFKTPYLPIVLRVKRIPVLAWQVIYVVEKVSEPNMDVLVGRVNDYRAVTQ